MPLHSLALFSLVPDALLVTLGYEGVYLVLDALPFGYVPAYSPALFVC